MKLFLKFIIFAFFLLTPFFLNTHKAEAAIVPVVSDTDGNGKIDESDLTFTVKWTGLDTTGKIKYYLYDSYGGFDYLNGKNPNMIDNGQGLTTTTGEISVNLCATDNNHLLVKDANNCNPQDNWFHGGKIYSIGITSIKYAQNGGDVEGKTDVTVERYIPLGQIIPSSGIKKDTDIQAKITGTKLPEIPGKDNQGYWRNNYVLEAKNSTRQVLATKCVWTVTPPSNPQGGTFQTADFGTFPNGHYSIEVLDWNEGEGSNSCSKDNAGSSYLILPFDVTDSGGSAETPIETKEGLAGQNPCDTNCVTALGTLPVNIKPLASKILSFAIGLAGGIALILMVFGSIRVLTSQGDQQRLNGGREMIAAAVAGLLFLIFSVLILRFIGVSILGLT